MNNCLSHELNEDGVTPVDVKSLANLILIWAKSLSIDITPMKLQKIVYYCHADFLVVTGQPLITQSFEAWEYGPVIPCLYQEFKDFGAYPIDRLAYIFNPSTCIREIATPSGLGDYEDIIRSTFEIYIKYTASNLSEMSHSETGPWAETLRRFAIGSPQGRKIENQVIKQCHRGPFAQSVH